VSCFFARQYDKAIEEGEFENASDLAGGGSMYAASFAHALALAG
jgi:hypothetical protein